jgi:hypothetical protein
LFLSHPAARIELMFPSDRAGGDTAPGPHEDLLSQDPGALGDRAKGLQARRDRLDAEEAELLIEIESLRARGRDYFRDTAAWLRQNTRIARATARHPSPCRPPVGGPTRGAFGVG